jgi:hypothetical protein
MARPRPTALDRTLIRCALRLDPSERRAVVCGTWVLLLAGPWLLWALTPGQAWLIPALLSTGVGVGQALVVAAATLPRRR